MEKYYLLDYIERNSGIDKETLDLIRYELEQRIYYYGGHFLFPKESSGNPLALLKGRLLGLLDGISLLWEQARATSGKIIVSNSYFSVNRELEKLGYNVFVPTWWWHRRQPLLGDKRFYRECVSMRRMIDKSDFIDFLTSDFSECLKGFKEKFADYYTSNNVSALIVPYDISFFEKISLKIFKEIGKPSFIFLHGLPYRYNLVDESRSDNLIVWGPQIRQNYMKAGVSGDRILIAGHPSYKSIGRSNLRFGLENILVISKAVSGGQPGGDVIISDRGNSILYLYSIQRILRGMGVSSVRLRVHPSEDIKWYMKYIDNGFFKPDKDILKESLESSSLVIGPTSTVFLESAYYGVSYLIYEPAAGDVDIVKYKLVPPFDGSDPKIPVAADEEKLGELLRSRTSADISFLGDYIKTPFDISFIKKYV